MAKANTKKSSGKWIALLVSLLVIVALVVTLIVFSNKKATAVMECSIPETNTAVLNNDKVSYKANTFAKTSTNAATMQFVLDQNNKVMAVNYLNDNAEAMFKEVNFNGKSAEDAAQMFVSISTKYGKIDLDTKTTGTTVSINISCEKTEEFTKLQEKVTSTVNKYFAENGIIAKAVTEVKADLEEAATKLGVRAKEIANKTADEILKAYEETSKDLQEVSVTFKTEFLNKVNKLKETIVDVADQTLTTAKQKLDELEKNVSGVAKDLIKEAKKAVKEAEKKFDEAKKQLDKKIDEVIAKFKEQSKQAWNSAKTTIKAWEDATKQIIENHKTAYEADKATIDATIKAFQQGNK